jgi:lipoprotein-anchoring transpeptidase ErfK/SrfK
MLAAALPAAAAAQTPAGEVLASTIADPFETLAVGETVTLSNEKSITRWANANDPQPIRVAPMASAPQITRLRYLTEDKLPEVYLVLEGSLDATGEPWLHIRIPMRPNNRTGWVHADALSQLHVVRTQLVIDRRAKRATLYKTGAKIWSAPVGIGKAATPTPKGNFWIRERLRGDNKTYGPWAFGTSAYSNLSDWPKGGVVGIHGTNQPGLIPGRPSHGCVRIRNPKIRSLSRLMPIGTPLQVIN